MGLKLYVSCDSCAPRALSTPPRLLQVAYPRCEACSHDHWAVCLCEGSSRPPSSDDLQQSCRGGGRPFSYSFEFRKIERTDCQFCLHACAHRAICRRCTCWRQRPSAGTPPRGSALHFPLPTASRTLSRGRRPRDSVRSHGRSDPLLHPALPSNEH